MVDREQRPDQQRNADQKQLCLASYGTDQWPLHLDSRFIMKEHER